MPIHLAVRRTAATALILVCSGSLPAVDYFWNNSAGDRILNNPANWSPTPTAFTGGHNWIINVTDLQAPVVTAGQSLVLQRNIYIGDTNNGAIVGAVGELTIDGGSLDLERNFRIGRVGGVGTLTVLSGSLRMGYGLYVGQQNSVGTVNFLGGTVSISDALDDGIYISHQNPGTSTFRVGGDAVVTVHRGNARFGDGGSSTVTLAIEGGALLVPTTSVRIAFGEASQLTFSMSGGEFQAPRGYFTFGEAADAQVQATMSGGRILADRLSFANRPTTQVNFTMTGGKIEVVQSGASTATTSGSFRLSEGISSVSIGGTAEIDTEKFYFLQGGALTLAGQARILVRGSKDGTNPTFNFTLQDLEDGLVLGRIIINGGSFEVMGAVDPVSAVNYAELLGLAIARGAILTEVPDAQLVAAYDASSDTTRIGFGSAEPGELPIPGIQAGAEGLVLEWQQAAAMTVNLQAADTLAGPWSNLESFTTTGEPATKSYTEPDWEAAAQKFYRLSRD